MYDEDNDALFAGARSRDIWIRGLLTLLFLAILWFIRLIVLILAAFQFVHAIVTREPNRRVLPFGRSVAVYMRQLVSFVTWNTEIRPWPWSPWPAGGVADDDPAEDTPPAPSSDWDEPFEPDAAYEPPEPAAEAEPPIDEPPVVEPVAADEPPAPPKSGGARSKKKKKPSGRKPASEDIAAAGDEIPGDESPADSR